MTETVVASETYRERARRRTRELEKARRARHAAVLRVLQTGVFVGAADVAREAGVSVRTVYRDVEDLRARGYVIRGEAGVGYEFRGKEE
jgi:predicted DNA-binding transcriptional regulator YafY